MLIDCPICGHRHDLHVWMACFNERAAEMRDQILEADRVIRVARYLHERGD